jgi:hypothetical protein
MTAGPQYAEGRFRFVADVLLHKMVHHCHTDAIGEIDFYSIFASVNGGLQVACRGYAQERGGNPSPVSPSVQTYNPYRSSPPRALCHGPYSRHMPPRGPLTLLIFQPTNCMDHVILSQLWIEHDARCEAFHPVKRTFSLKAYLHRNTRRSLLGLIADSFP